MIFLVIVTNVTLQRLDQNCLHERGNRKENYTLVSHPRQHTNHRNDLRAGGRYSGSNDDDPLRNFPTGRAFRIMVVARPLCKEVGAEETGNDYVAVRRRMAL